MGDKTPGQLNQIHVQEKIIHHQNMIMAITDAIQPSILKQYWQDPTPEDLKAYFDKVIENQYGREKLTKTSEHHKKTFKDHITRILERDFENGIKQSISIDDAYLSSIEHQTIINNLESQKSGVRNLKATKSIPINLNHKKILDKNEDIEVKQTRSRVKDLIFKKNRG